MFAELRQLDALNAKQVRGPTAARYRGVWSSALLLLCWSTGRLPPSHQGLDFLVHLSSGTPPRAPGLIKGQDSGSPEAGQPKHSGLNPRSWGASKCAIRHLGPTMTACVVVPFTRIFFVFLCEIHFGAKLILGPTPLAPSFWACHPYPFTRTMP